MVFHYVCLLLCFFFFFFKQKTAYEMLRSLVGSEMCIRDSINAEYGKKGWFGMQQQVNTRDVIMLLLADGKDPAEVAHLGDPETDHLLLEMGVTLDPPHRTLLRAGIRAYNRDIRARNGVLDGWESGNRHPNSADGASSTIPLATEEPPVPGSARHDFMMEYERNQQGDAPTRWRERSLEGYVKDQKLQMQAFLELREEQDWWCSLNKRLLYPSNQTQQTLVKPIQVHDPNSHDRE
eukprot:TRINITY_DN2075_c0_g1_i17.p1 TRINITY_DN2075_c0_g1~~TRINITY_DN2075_c0_g1_i17.p1  ORF type:complete len:236 (-),score=58.10 TRINITY_DN2075_c0_g1_i17:170-877(-)